MESIEKEHAVDVGSSGAAADVGSSRPPGDVGSSRPPGDVGSAGPAADVGSSEPPGDVDSLEPPGDVGKKVEKGLKGKQKIKLEETKSSNEGEHLKSHVYGTLHSRMSPSSIVFSLKSNDCLFQYESDRAQERNKMFCEVVDLEFSKTIIPKKDIELFFFPVFEKDHYYMICFNTTTDCGTIEVIDYSEGAEENKKLLKNLKSAFSYFINGEGSTQSVVWSKQIKSMEFVLVDLPWKSLDDHHLHCGVAMMRHMETYMGSQKWNLGLKKNNDIIIEKLRLKYTLSIISSEANIVKPVKQVVQKKKKAKEANDSE